MHVDDLSAVAQDYLKVIWASSEWGEAPITTKGLARRFATTAANVSVTLRRLEGQGLVSYQPYRPATLTPLGRRLAIAMVRRHRLLETFLAQVLGYSMAEVHAEAERLEHAVTDELLARIDQQLGFPRVDPHGDLIPDIDGGWAPVPETLALSAAAAGVYRIWRVSDADPVVLAQLAELAVAPGALLEVRSQAPWLLINGTVLELTPGQAGAIRVALAK